jgi:protein-tyrosine phosphatase
MAESLTLARAASEGGTRQVVATPHVREDHVFELERIAEGIDRLARTLSEEGVELELASGGELSIEKARELGDEELRTVALGEGSALLVESPYAYVPDVLEHTLFDLQVRGFRPVLAHPERSPSFTGNFERLEALVERGVLCSITAGSMAGAFGGTVKRFTARALAKGLVHDVASDAHDAFGRPPLLQPGFEALEAELPGLAEHRKWLTREAPAAILDGRELPPRPGPPPRERGRRGLLGRRR